MQFNPITITAHSESVQEVIKPALGLKKENIDAWAVAHDELCGKMVGLGFFPMLNMFDQRRRYHNQLKDALYTPVGRATIPWNGGQVYLKRVGFITIAAPPEDVGTIPQALICVGPDGWVWFDESVDEDMEPLTSKEAERLDETLRFLDINIKLLVSNLEGDPDQHWGYITTLKNAHRRIFQPSPSELMYSYSQFEQMTSDIAYFWERTHAKWLHHVKLADEDDYLHEFTPTPLHLLTDISMTYRQALILATRWVGFERFQTNFGKDPYLMYMTWYWGSRLLQSHLCQSLLLSCSPFEVDYINYVVETLRDYFSKRRGDEQPSTLVVGSAIDYTPETDYTPISPLVEKYINDVLDKLRFEGFSG